MPRELWALSPDKMEMREFEVPPVGEGQVKVKTEAGAAKHGTEMAFIKGYAEKRGKFDRELEVFDAHAGEPNPQPMPVGNMFVGTVTEVGKGVDTLKEGDRLLSYGPFREVQVVGADRCWTMSKKMDWRSAVCLDPADFALGAIRDGGVKLGDAVAIFGMGAIGLMAVGICKLAGAHPVIAVEPLENRRQAAQACGADIVLNPLECDAGLEIKKAVPTPGVDVAIEYSGNVHALQSAIKAAAYGGTVVAGAFSPPYPAGLDFGAEAHRNVVNLIFSRACSEPNRDYPRWSEDRIFEVCWRLLCEGKLTADAVVNPVVTFENLVTEYPKIISDPGSNIKLGATF